MERTTVNIVDRGADDSGTWPINDVLVAAHGTDREIYFPPGRYRLGPATLAGSNWSLHGDDATLVVPGNVDRDWLTLRGSDWEVDGFTVDLETERAAPATRLSGTDWGFRNVSFRGTMGDPSYGRSGTAGAQLVPSVTSVGATGLVENVDMTDGSAPVGRASNRSGIVVPPDSRGHLRCRGVHLARWAGGPLDAAQSSGPVTIEDSLVRRSNVGVRLGGDAIVRNCVFLQDDGVPIQEWSGAAYGRGLWLNPDRHDAGPILVDRCDFTMTGHGAGDAIVNGHSVDHLTIRNSAVKVTGGRRALDVRRGMNRVDVHGLDVTGEGATPTIRVSGGGTATEVCTPRGRADVQGIDAIDVQQGECRRPRTTLERGLDEEFAHLRITSRAQPDYEFVVEGTVRPGPDADVEDVITRREDGTTTVAGFVGYGGSDDYYVKGTVTDFRFVHRDPTVELDDHVLPEVDPPWNLRPEMGEEGTEPETGEATEREAADASNDPDGGEDQQRPEPRRKAPRYVGGGRFDWPRFGSESNADWGE